MRPAPTFGHQFAQKSGSDEEAVQKSAALELSSQSERCWTYQRSRT